MKFFIKKVWDSLTALVGIRGMKISLAIARDMLKRYDRYFDVLDEHVTTTNARLTALEARKDVSK